MKNTAITSLQILVVLVGAVVLAALLREPWLEGVNAGATSFSQTYLDDPFLAYIYIAFISFFVALYRAFRALGYVRAGRAHSAETASALRIIRMSGLILAGFMAVAIAFLMFVQRGSDDIAGGVAVGLFITLAALAFAAVASKLEKMIRMRLNG
jgi:hypothetical protein